MTEEMDNIIVLTDEDGNDVEFEHVCTVEHKGKEYICLIPLEDEESEEDENALIFLEILPGASGKEDVYRSVEDEKLLNTLYTEYLAIVEEEDGE